MRTLRAFLLAILVAASVSAGWTRAGLYGADVRALAVDPADADLLFLGTSQGEVYRSTDGGRTWRNPRESNPFPGYVVDNLAIDSSGRLWAAAWGLWSGSVVAVSDDRGVTWTRRDQKLRDLSLRAFAVDPSNPSHLVAGALNGVYRSKDDGVTWSRISTQANVESVAIDPRRGDTIYIGTWRQAWRTDDGGANWKHIAQGMVLDTDVFAINIDPKNPDDVWMSTCGWVYNSKDRGDSWTRHKDGFENRRIHAIERHPKDPSTLFAGSVAGLYCSRDAGKKWSLVSPESIVVNAIAMHPEAPERIVLATEGDGIYISHDSGATWNRSSEGLYNVRVASVTPDPMIEHRVYAPVFFGPSSAGVYVSDDGGANWARLNETPLPEVLSLVVRKDAEPRFLAGTIQGFFWSADGKRWERAEPLITPVRVEKILEYSTDRLFGATAVGVFTSRDGGRKWYRLKLDKRTGDVALGWIGSGPALFALTSEGLQVFDGSEWKKIAGAPEKGQTLAVQRQRGRSLVMVAGSHGVRAGTVDTSLVWNPVEAPRGEYGTAYAPTPGEGTIFVSFNDRHEIHVYDGKAGRWKTVGIPTRLRDVAGIAADPFHENRFYLGTHGQGILIWDESARRTVEATPAPSAHLGGGSR